MMPTFGEVFFLVAFASISRCDLGLPQYPPNETYQPLASNKLDFLGFNFTDLPPGNTFAFNPSAEKWQVQFNYSIEPIFPYGYDEHYNTTINSYALYFPEGRFPAQNQTTWTLCTYFWISMLPANISSIIPPAGTASGDCTPYLGQACVTDYAKAFSEAALYGPCPLPPAFIAIPSCAARLGVLAFTDIRYLDVMNWLEPGVGHINYTYFNSSTRQPVDSPKIEGLQSGQIIKKLGSSYGAIDNTTIQRKEADMLHVFALTQFPSEEWIAAQNRSFATPVMWTQFSDVRLVCGRPNGSYTGEPASAPTQTPASRNVGAVGKSNTIFNIVAAVLLGMCCTLV